MACRLQFLDGMSLLDSPRAAVVVSILGLVAALPAALACSDAGGVAPPREGSSFGSGQGGDDGSGGVGGVGGVGAGGNGGGYISQNDGGAEPPDEECGGFELQVERVPGTVLVVFDQSMTMDRAYEGVTPTASKWSVAREAITSALLPVAPNLDVGALFYPTSHQTCDALPITAAPQIPFADGMSFLASFDAHFLPPFTTLGMTPLLLAMQRAEQAFPEPPLQAGPRIVVLLTDGAAVSCGDPAPTVNVISAMHVRGIVTYVIGLPGASSGAALLNQMAAAGGTGTYLEPGNATQLEAELAGIAVAAIDDCQLTLDPAPPDTDDVHLLVDDGSGAGLVEVPQGPDGWSLAPDGSSATLTGATCDRARAGELDTIRVVYGCPDAVIQ